MKTKKTKNEVSLREPAKKMMSFLGAVAMLGTSFPVATTAQSTQSNISIEQSDEKGVLSLQVSADNESTTENLKPSDCQWGCSGSCWSSCQSSCRSTCSAGCTGTCMGGCKATCSNGCNAGSGYHW